MKGENNDIYYNILGGEYKIGSVYEGLKGENNDIYYNILGGEYKIGSVYEGLKGEDTAPVSGDPWIPVDINLVTPWHLTHK